MKTEEILNKLKSLSSDEHLKSMAKLGINTANAYGVKVEDIRSVAKEIGTDHETAIALWGTKVHEAMILATIVADIKSLSNALLEEWVLDLNSWDLCDQFCVNLVSKSRYASMKILEWSTQDEIYVKRAGFATMANYARFSEEVREQDIEGFFTLILNESWDKRNYVRKAVSWAIRSIGKRSLHYNRKAVRIAKILKDEGSKPAKLTASEAIKELQKSDLLNRLKDEQKTG
jgi:3-methyladenine DNA glycosylase AlkD